LNAPMAVAVAADGSLYVADSRNARVRRVGPTGTISTVAGGGSSITSRLPGTSLQLQFPTGVAVKSDGTVYIADAAGGRVWRLLADGTVVLVAGTSDGWFSGGFSGDGGPATSAQLNDPFSVAVAPDGTLYITDRDNYRVRRVL